MSDMGDSIFWEGTSFLRPSILENAGMPTPVAFGHLRAKPAFGGLASASSSDKNNFKKLIVFLVRGDLIKQNVQY